LTAPDLSHAAREPPRWLGMSLFDNSRRDNTLARLKSGAINPAKWRLLPAPRFSPYRRWVWHVTMRLCMTQTSGSSSLPVSLPLERLFWPLIINCSRS